MTRTMKNKNKINNSNRSKTNQYTAPTPSTTAHTSTKKNDSHNNSSTTTVNNDQLLLLCLDYLRSLRRSQHHSFTPPVGSSRAKGNSSGGGNGDGKDNHQNPPHQDYLTLAIWALDKSLSCNLDGHPGHHSLHHGDEPHANNITDSFFTSSSIDCLSLQKTKSDVGIPSWTRNISIPALSVMESQLLHPRSTTATTTTKTDNVNGGAVSSQVLEVVDELYPYDDMHPSNLFRLYKCNGLDGMPLTLPYLVHCALDISSIKGMSRKSGYELLRQNELFQKFQDAVEAKGFFHVSEQDIMERYKSDQLDQEQEGKAKRGGMKTTTRSRNIHHGRLTKIQREQIRKEIHEERRLQVVEKFRQKLLESGMMQGWKEEEEDSKGMEDKRVGNEEREAEEESCINVADEEEEATVAGSVLGDVARGRSRQTRRGMDKNRANNDGDDDDEEEKTGGIFFSDSSSDVKANKRRLTSNHSKRMSMMGQPTRQDLQEAESLKVRGNACMQQKKYSQARDFYTKALELVPMGPTSHVYYSNRAAALLSMRNFTEAVWDAERSIQLKPKYPKAHARLGLARFLLGQYKEAVESYTRAVELEPTNETSISYLEKSKRKVADASLSTRNVVSVDNEHGYGDIDDISISSKRTISQRAKDTIAKANSRRSSIHASGSFTSHSEFMPQEYLKQQSDTSFEDASLSENKLEEANRYKVEGNKAMARRDYTQAIQHYSKALRLAPAGPQSHVYFSNRAAALCYLERYEEAELDAE